MRSRTTLQNRYRYNPRRRISGYEHRAASPAGAAREQRTEYPAVGDNDQAIYRFRGASSAASTLSWSVSQDGGKATIPRRFAVSLTENLPLNAQHPARRKPVIGMNTVSADFPKKV